MRRTLSASLAAFLLAALPASAEFYGGTERDAIALGGSLFYDTGSANGKDLSLEAHGGYYVLDAFLLGGSLAARNDDVADTYELALLGQYHVLNAFDPANDRPWGFSPYVGARVGVARGKDVAESHWGALAGLRLGVDLFLTDNVVLDFAFDMTACSADVYPDDGRLKNSDFTLRVGIDFHF
jgi:opacity protein-like surface antigen